MPPLTQCTLFSINAHIYSHKGLYSWLASSQCMCSLDAAFGQIVVGSTCFYHFILCSGRSVLIHVSTGSSSLGYFSFLHGVCVVRIFKLRVLERGYPGAVNVTEGVSALKYFSVTYCMCMNGENSSALMLKMLYVDCIRFNVSLIQISHLVLRPLYVLTLAIMFHFIWVCMLCPLL